jgi:hypothetical protein
MIQLGMGAAAKCQIILARALSSTDEHGAAQPQREIWQMTNDQ